MSGSDSLEHVERGTALEVGAHLVGLAEVAARANTTAGTVRSWRGRHADFPAPIASLAAGPVWWWPEVEAWLARPRKAGRKPSA